MTEQEEDLLHGAPFGTRLHGQRVGSGERSLAELDSCTSPFSRPWGTVTSQAPQGKHCMSGSPFDWSEIDPPDPTAEAPTARVDESFADPSVVTGWRLVHRGLRLMLWGTLVDVAAGLLTAVALLLVALVLTQLEPPFTVDEWLALFFLGLCLLGLLAGWGLSLAGKILCAAAPVSGRAKALVIGSAVCDLLWLPPIQVAVLERLGVGISLPAINLHLLVLGGSFAGFVLFLWYLYALGKALASRALPQTVLRYAKVWVLCVLVTAAGLCVVFFGWMFELAGLLTLITAYLDLLRTARDVVGAALRRNSPDE